MELFNLDILFEIEKNGSTHQLCIDRVENKYWFKTNLMFDYELIDRTDVSNYIAMILEDEDRFFQSEKFVYVRDLVIATHFDIAEGVPQKFSYINRWAEDRGCDVPSLKDLEKRSTDFLAALFDDYAVEEFDDYDFDADEEYEHRREMSYGYSDDIFFASLSM